MDTQITVNNSLTPEEAFNLDVEIKSLRKGTIIDFWKMVHKFGRMREFRGWVVLDYESWESYLAQPEIDYAGSTVNRLIEIYVNIYKYIKNTPDQRTFDIVQLDPLLLGFDASRAKLLAPRISNDLLTKAEHLSYSDFVKEIEALRLPPLPTPPPPVGTYNVIVIDPAWPYGTEYDLETRRIASPYHEQPIEEIKTLPIPSAPDCAMFLWTTHRFLPDAFELLRCWGFEYKLTLVWDKQKMGMGAWLRCQAEFCLLGIKGNPTWQLTNERDVISEARREHSRKPEAFYEMVKRLTPNAKRIDYFSREKREGFDQYGNEPDKFTVAE